MSEHISTGHLGRVSGRRVVATPPPPTGTGGGFVSTPPSGTLAGPSVHEVEWSGGQEVLEYQAPTQHISYEYRYDHPDDLLVYVRALEDMSADARNICVAFQNSHAQVKEQNGQSIDSFRDRVLRRGDSSEELHEDLRRYAGAVLEFVRDLRSLRRALWDIRDYAELNKLEVDHGRKLVLRPEPGEKLKQRTVTVEQADELTRLVLEHETKIEAFRECIKMRREADEDFARAKRDMRDAIAAFSVAGADESKYNPDRERYERLYKDPNAEPKERDAVEEHERRRQLTMRELLGGRASSTEHGIDPQDEAVTRDPETGKYALSEAAQRVIEAENQQYTEAAQRAAEANQQATTSASALDTARQEYESAKASGADAATQSALADKLSAASAAHSEALEARDTASSEMAHEKREWQQMRTAASQMIEQANADRPTR